MPFELQSNKRPEVHRTDHGEFHVDDIIYLRIVNAKEKSIGIFVGVTNADF